MRSTLREYGLRILLLAASVATTTANGARFIGLDCLGIFLLIPAMRHPKVHMETSLSRGRLILGTVGIVIFLLTFTPTPFYDNSLMHFMHIDPLSATH